MTPDEALQRQIECYRRMTSATGVNGDSGRMNDFGWEISRQSIAEFCRRRHIRRLALFGSMLRDDFGPMSDIDVVVEFEPGATPGFGFIDVQDELSKLLGRRADLHTPASLGKYFRDQVLREAETLYDMDTERTQEGLVAFSARDKTARDC